MINKLQNKRTGEIGYLWANKDTNYKVLDENDCVLGVYDTLPRLIEEWEDYEEPKDFYIVEQRGTVGSRFRTGDEYEKMFKEIGNYFETEEEAKKAVEKLKAWQRLKEAGFEFGGWTHTPITKSLTGYNLHIKAYSDKLADYMDDLQLLFGGEE